MGATKWNGFGVFVFAVTIQGSRLVISTTPESVVTERNGPYTASVCEYDEVGLTICCKEDERLDVAYASYGRDNKQHEPANCHPDWPCSSNTTKTLSIVRSLCSGLSNCTVRADNSIFGDPCVNTKKYLAVIYYCYPGNMTVNETMPDADLFKYLAMTHPCHTVPLHFETTPDTDLITSSLNRESLKSSCNGLSCEAEKKRKVNWTATRSNSTATLPCPNNNDVTEQNGLYTVSVCENNEATICCNENESLHILYANYGRNDRHEPANCYAQWGKSCSSNNSLSIVRKLCSRLSNCSVSVSNGIFGDPCVNTKKYLAVIHRCYPGSMAVPSGNETISDTHLLKYPAVTHQCQPGFKIIHTTQPPEDERTSDTDPITSSTVKSSSNRVSSNRDSSNSGSSTTPYSGPICPAEKKRKVNWTATSSDSTATLPCPNNIDLIKADRLCESTAEWSRVVDLSECISKEILALQDKLDNLRNNFSLVLVHELMNGLEEVSTGDELYGGDLVALAKIMVGVIHLTGSNSRMNFSEANRINEAVVNTTSTLLQRKNNETWMDLPKTNQSSTATRLLSSVESSLAILANSINEIRIFNNSAPGLQVDVLVDVMSPKNFSTSFYTGDKVDYLSSKDIMPEAGNGLGRVAVALFNGVAQWLHVNDAATNSSDLNSSSAENESSSDATPEVIVITRVMSISIVSWSGKDAGLNEKVRYTLEHKETKSNDSKQMCVFWKYSKETFEGHWSDEGCRDVTNCSDSNYTVCECNHLTNFAVLMSVSGHTMSVGHAFALSVITYIGCIISIICLALAFITFYWFKGLECDRNTIHKNLVLCLFIAEVIFLLGIGRYDHMNLCAIVAGSLHYFFLASFSWMFLEGVQLYVLLIEVFEAEKSRLRWYYLSGYGAPVLIVSISAVTAYVLGNRYAAVNYCWLSTDGGLIWAFTGPVAVIIFMNSVMLGVAIHTMCKHSSTASSLKDKQKSKIDTIGSFVRGAVALMILMGSTWIFGFLYINNESLFMAYIFTILNSLQGLFIFIFHCLTNEKVRKEYRRCIQLCTWLPADVRIKYGGLSGSAALSTTPNQSNSSGVPNRKRNQSITSSSFQNSSSENGNVPVVISSPEEIPNGLLATPFTQAEQEIPNGLLATPFTQAEQVGSTTSHKVKRHGSSASESAMVTDSSLIPSSD